MKEGSKARSTISTTDDFGEEGARPSSLIPVHKLAIRDPHHDLQLLRDVEIINARTRAELGPPPRHGARAHRGGNNDSVSVETAPRLDQMDDTHDAEGGDAVRLHKLVMTATVGLALAGTDIAKGDHDPSWKVAGESSSGLVSHGAVDKPVWPTNNVAQRELGDDLLTWPENMFVEHANGQWTAWVLSTPERGQGRAMDFFTGEVIDAWVDNPGGYNESFTDARGVLHARSTKPSFEYKDPRPGGGVADIDFSSRSLAFEDGVPCAGVYLNVSTRVPENDDEEGWSKVPLYKSEGGCHGGVWDSLVNTALDLRDGTLLITGDQYIFRVRSRDMSPVGEAPALHVVNEADVRRVIDAAKGKDINNAADYLSDELRLR